MSILVFISMLVIFVILFRIFFLIGKKSAGRNIVNEVKETVSNETDKIKEKIENTVNSVIEETENQFSSRLNGIKSPHIDKPFSKISVPSAMEIAEILENQIEKKIDSETKN